jgi:hypothetical protein
MDDPSSHVFDEIKVGSIEGSRWEMVKICRSQELRSAEARDPVYKAEDHDRPLHAMTGIQLRGFASCW